MLIIADDLSGAADCGIACTMAGLDTVVLLGEATGPVRADAIAVDADTRRKPAADAAAETARIVRAHAAPGQLLFKKLDSTLRGHISAEIAATLATRRALHGDAVAVMAPAFPATGRTTVRGHQWLHGVRLEHTEVWKAEAIQGEAHIPSMLAAAGLCSVAIHLDVVRDAARLRAALSTVARSHDVIVCDAEAEADLQAIAEASLLLGRHTVWAGSAGLARHLPAAAGLQRDRRLERVRPERKRSNSYCASNFIGPGSLRDSSQAGIAPAALPPADAPILFVVGSASRVSHEQVARLAAAPGVELVTVPPAVLRAGANAMDWNTRRLMIETALAAGHDTVIRLDSEGEVDLAEGLPLCLAFAALAAPFAHRAGALVATGGETARAVLLASGATQLRLIGELEAGVPIGIATGSRDLPVITKAGAFGHPDTLLHCRTALRSGVAAVSRRETC